MQIVLGFCTILKRVKSNFFVIKQRFGEFVSTKNPFQTNEILAKILCHNVCDLIQEVFLSNRQGFDYYARRYFAQPQ